RQTYSAAPIRQSDFSGGTRMSKQVHRPRGSRLARCGVLTALLVSLAGALPAVASAKPPAWSPPQGTLIVSGSRYRTADIEPGVTVLPPGCIAGCATATADGAYPYVFNNDLVDSSFGVAAPVFLQSITRAGAVLSTFQVPTDQLVTSFSSKSE